jgi:hypothetical protein
MDGGVSKEKGSSSSSTSSYAMSATVAPPVLLRPRIRIVSAPEARSHGDALRTLDSNGSLRGDGAFILIEGGVVGHARVNHALAAHVARAKADPNTTLTALVTSSAPRPALDASVLAVDSRDGRVWGYVGAALARPAVAARPLSVHGRLAKERSPAGGARVCALGAPRALKPEAARGVSARGNDIRLTSVYIASPQVLVHFSDNADYACLRADYIAHEAANVDMGWRFHVHRVHGAISPVRDVRGCMAVGVEAAAGWGMCGSGFGPPPPPPPNAPRASPAAG